MYIKKEKQASAVSPAALGCHVGKADCPGQGEDLALWIFCSGAECVENN